MYIVVFYTSQRKENEFKIHHVYDNKEEALNFIESLTTTDTPGDNSNVRPIGEVILDLQCGMEDPHDEEDDEIYKQKNKLYEEYLEKEQIYYTGMSWTPRVCIIKV